jgi:hypothetical protein
MMQLDCLGDAGGPGALADNERPMMLHSGD